MATKHKDCTELQLTQKDVEYLSKAVKKLEIERDVIDKTILTIKKDISEVQTVNAFLAKEIKDIMDIKINITNTILKYASKFFFIIFSIGAILILIKFGPNILNLLK